MPPKSIFRQPGAKHFQLVHRSQRDPLIHDPDASQHVLKPIERENVKKGKSRADLEAILPSSVTANDKLANVGEAALYGIYYDDTEYNYMQHLRAVGVQEEGVESVLIEAPSTSKSSKAAAKKSQGIELRDLPQEVLASKSELPRTYESQQAVPESISGFQPDMDPHLRQVLEALDDDAFVNDNLEDNFFSELVADGERASDEEVDFEFEDDGYEAPAGGQHEDDEKLGWEERFAQFKQAQKQKHASSDDGYDGSEGGDTVGTLPAISVIGGKKRRKGTSDASGYSMSSSSMYRNEALQTLDERFDQMILKQYADDDDTPSSEEDNDSDEAPELITSREDFESMMDEFLNDYEILGRKMKPKLDGETGAEKLDTIRRALGQDERVRIGNEDEEDEEEDILMPLDVDDKKDRWDCETILSTYSNLENHPRLIRARDSRPVAKITLDPKTGFPTVIPPQQKQLKKIPGVQASHQESDDDSGSETDTPARQTISRPRGESKEDKKARKAAVKAERQARRIEKKATSEQFGSELKLQKRTVANKEKKLKKLLMALTPNLSTNLLLLTIVVILLPVKTYAFGAGDIPDFSYLNDKAFRHGDIENILEGLPKTAEGVAIGGGLLSLAQSVFQRAAGGSKFTKSDIKKCMDIAGLSKLTAETLVLIVSVLGFVTFGFATEEFQVTADRLGVYLPVEHIDNPKQVMRKKKVMLVTSTLNFVLQSILVNSKSMNVRKYMATEGQGWDTSTAFIRRTFRACIEAGRRAGGQEGADLWEAYRLLGTGLHTVEDLFAHSNWCEVALRKLGHEDVFCHVGDNGADFIYSLMGEATDKLSQASVTEITQKMNQAGDSDDNINKLKNILSKLPLGRGKDEVEQGDEMSAAARAYHFDPDNIAPPEVQERLWQLLKWRDQVYREIIAKIEMVPGLANLLDEVADALNECTRLHYTFSLHRGPLLQQATGVLGEGSKSIIDSEDQYQDHFDLILNEPAGKIAQLVVQNSVNLIVQAWAHDNDPDQVIDKVLQAAGATMNRILEAFHHPYYASSQSEIQHQMFDHMDRWIGGLDHDQAAEIIQRLTKDSVRNARNKRPASENETTKSANYSYHSHSSTSAENKPPSSYERQMGRDQYSGSPGAGSNEYERLDNYRQGNRYGLNDLSYHNSYAKSHDEYNTGSQYESSNNYDAHREYNSSNDPHVSSSRDQHQPDYATNDQYDSSNNSDHYKLRDNTYGFHNTSGFGRVLNESGDGGRNARSSGTYGDYHQVPSYSQAHSKDQFYSDYAGARTETRHGQDSDHRLNDYNPEREGNRYTTGQSEETSDTYGSGEGHAGYQGSKYEGGYIRSEKHQHHKEEGRFGDQLSYEASGRHGAIGGQSEEEYLENSRDKGSYAFQNEGRVDYGSSSYEGREESARYGRFGDDRIDETFGIGHLNVNDDETYND
ncbi:hypothetical protein H0H92_004490 [Tricholoma furcatifolium]|nr:hypothetical protein H0H92_004490 [Tricholoma furcatifolium]